MSTTKKILLPFLSFLFLMIFILPANSATINDLKNKIINNNTSIEQIKNEIEKYQNEIDALGGKSNTLKNSIKKLNIRKHRLEADILFTQSKINLTTSRIDKLNSDIAIKVKEISNSSSAISQMIREMDKMQTNTLIEVILSNDTLSSFLNNIDNLEQLQNTVNQNLKKLENLKRELDKTKMENEKQKKTLESSRGELGDQKQITENNRLKKNRLLYLTKNKESNYKRLLTQKKQLKEKLEREIADYESQLRVAIDPNSIPKAGTGIFFPPLSKISYKSCYSGGIGNCVTQFFGNTRFAKSGAYNGKGHNGVDFRASVGTQVHAVLSGFVVETGNTDAYKGCYSYGKWVLVRHNNGLSTLYAHLNLIKVKAGQKLSTGEVIGYSGESGYTTGPHLHLTTLVTKGVKIVRLGDIKKITHCTNARIPVAPFNSYLNSLDYL